MQRTETELLLFELFREPDDTIRSERAEQLWYGVLAQKANPITSTTRALFLYHGDSTTVQISADWTFWQPSAALERVPKTKLFYVILEFPIDARLQYKLVADGIWQLDPANNRIVEEGFGFNNEFWMPGYVDRSYVDVGQYICEGVLERVVLESAILASHREIFFYYPKSIPHPTTAHLLIVHDGSEALRLGKFHRILDNLHALGLIAPTVACFLTPGDRNSEYVTSDQYIHFTATELIKSARDFFQEHGIVIPHSPRWVGVTGASLGGLLATKTALIYPDMIGNVLAQSPSYWWNQGEIFRSRYIRNAPKVRIVIQTGTVCDAQQLSRLMAKRLESLGGHVDYFEYAQGHTWGNWRTTFAEGIRAVFPPEYLPPI